MTRPWLGAAVSVLVVLCLRAGGRIEADSVAHRQTGTAAGSVTGRVELGEAGQRVPVRRAKVSLSTGSVKNPVVVWTDSDGRYRADLPAAAWRITIEKPGFVDAAGAVTAGGSITVRPAQTAAFDATFRRAGAIEGRFLTHTGEPVWKLDVVADRLNANGDPDGTSYKAITDDLGRFRLHTLPPGRYRVSALPPPPASGERLYLPGTPSLSEAAAIDVESGITTGPFEVTVPQAEHRWLAGLDPVPPVNQAAPAGPSAVRGRVVHLPTDEPMADVRVELLTNTQNIRASGWTQADGTFLFEKLPAGRYFVRARIPGFLNRGAIATAPGGIEMGVEVVLEEGRPSEPVTVPVFRSSAVEATLLDEFGDPAPGIQLQLFMRLYMNGATYLTPFPGVEGATSDDRGRVRFTGVAPGDFYLVAIPEPFASSGGVFVPTFFPGTTSAEAATPIRIVAGRDALGVTFRLGAGVLTTLTGIAVDHERRPAPGARVLIMAAPDPDVAPLFTTTTQADHEGRFAVPGVPTGRYFVSVGRANLFGSEVWVAAADDRAPRTLQMKPTASLQGRVRFDGEPRDARPELSLYMRQLDPVPVPLQTAKVEPDGTFQFKGLIGRSMLELLGAGGWAISRVMHGGRDITHAPLDSQDGDVTDLEVVVTNRLATLSGFVRTGTGTPQPDAVVIAYGTEGTSWPYTFRTTRAVRSDAQGAFTIPELLPGRYVVTAVSTLSGRVLDPPVMSLLKPAGTPVTVTAGTSNRIELTVVR